MHRKAKRNAIEIGQRTCMSSNNLQVQHYIQQPVGEVDLETYKS